MKNYLLGVLTMFMLGMGFQIIWFDGLGDNPKMVDFGYHAGEALRGIYIVKIVTDRCNLRTNSRGMTSAQWFNCDETQIKLNKLIHGD